MMILILIAFIPIVCKSDDYVIAYLFGDSRKEKVSEN